MNPGHVLTVAVFLAACLATVLSQDENEVDKSDNERVPSRSPFAPSSIMGTTGAFLTPIVGMFLLGTVQPLRFRDLILQTTVSIVSLSLLCLVQNLIRC